jgi:GT2 family glycosyltransferase
MSSSLPRVSCIVPVHNGAAFIAQALESILAQQGAELEVIVIDDGSTDGSGDIAGTFAGVTVHRRPQGGVAAARNDGLAHATGEFIAFLDADDLWLPGKLAAQLAAIGDADYAITNVRHVKTGPDGRLPPDGGEAVGEVKLGQVMPCILARRSAFDRVGPLDTRTITRADQDWFVRANETGLRHVLVDEVLTIRRIHGGNHSLLHSKNVHADFLAIAKRALDRKRQAGVAIADTPVPAFKQAASRVPVAEMRVAIGPLSVLIRIAGPKLAERLFAPMRHIAVPTAGAPDLTICAWSIAETGIPLPVGVAWTYDEPYEWVRPGGGLIVSCLPSAEELQRISIARPFQWSLISALTSAGLPALHGALVAAPGSEAGLLLVGPNGSGKSTTCLSALQAGFQLVGEDVVVIERTTTGVIGHSLYCSCNLTQQTQALFANLPGPLILPHGAAPDAKSILILPPDGPQSPMRRSLPVAALVFTVITGEPGASRIIPISRDEAAERFEAALRQSKKLPDPHRRAHEDAALPLLAELPAFRLDLGTDLALVPEALSALSRSLE